MATCAKFIISVLAVLKFFNHIKMIWIKKSK